ncbi:MAG: EamA family transporter [Ignavibacteria bacterium]|nr:EamA family transporter [Ignavibacteria bacterium]
MQTWIIYAVLAMLFAGITSVIAKLGLKNISGDLGVGVRTAFVLIFVWSNILIFGHTKFISSLSAKDVLFLGISGLTTALSWIFYYKAIKSGEVSVVAIIDKASVLITVLLSFLILKEEITLKTIISLVLILSGLILMLWK